ncbi:hypothetical protein BGW80DRAFT_808572 [Lactifluus volemus]|nr:hypothetical protein BGW80DRAFT_808572 [Lactifluus volemus]
MLCVLVVSSRATNDCRCTLSLSQHTRGARLAQPPQRRACVFDGVRGFCEWGDMHQLLHLAGEDDMVTDCLSSPTLDLESGSSRSFLKSEWVSPISVLITTAEFRLGSSRVLDLPCAHACWGVTEEMDHGLFPLRCAQWAYIFGRLHPRRGPHLWL